MYNKERIKKAFSGEVMVGEDENGFKYGKASKEECLKEIIKLYDETVYQAIQAMRAGRATEKICERSLNVGEFQRALIEAAIEERDRYVYDFDIEED